MAFSVNDFSKFAVYFAAGPLLTWGITLFDRSNSEKRKTRTVINSIAAQVFWSCIHPYTTKKYFMGSGAVWQAHLTGIAGGVLISYVLARIANRWNDSTDQSTVGIVLPGVIAAASHAYELYSRS